MFSAQQENVSQGREVTKQNSQNRAQIYTLSGRGLTKIVILGVFLSVFIGLAYYYFTSIGRNKGVYWLNRLTGPKPEFNISSFPEFAKEVAKTEWDYQRVPVGGTVLSLDKEKRELQLMITWPPQVSGGAQNVKLECVRGDFWLGVVPSSPAAETRVLVTPEDFFTIIGDKLKEGSWVGVGGFCTDKGCNIINKGCELLP